MVRWFNIDDGFFYFKVARNATHGLGFTFDGINRTNGFHPLWMAVCVLVYSIIRTDLILPLRIFVVIGGILNGLSAIYLFKLLSRALNGWVALAMAVLWAIIPSIMNVTTMQGMETGLAIFLLLLLIERAQTWFIKESRPTYRQLFLFGLVAALAILARLDFIFYVAPICLFAFFDWRFRNHKLVFDIIAITSAAYLSWLVTIKVAQVDFSDYTVFPLLFIGVLVIPLILQLFKNYQLPKYRSYKDTAKDMGGILVAALVVVPILYFFNVLPLGVRFPKLVIILMVFFSAAFVGLNHLLHGVTSKACQPEKNPPLKFWQYVREALCLGSPIVVLLGTYFAFNLSYAHALMPVSGKMKHFWSTLANPVYGKARNFLDVFGIGERVNPWKPEISALQQGIARLMAWLGLQGSRYELILLFLALALLTSVFILLLKIARTNSLHKMNILLFPALFIGSLMRVGYYAEWGYIGIRNWYWIVERLILLILGALLLDLIAEKTAIHRTWKTVYAIGLAVLVGASLVKVGIRDIHSYPKLAAGTTGREELDFLSLLDDATPAGSIIGMTGGGMQGYFSTDRTVVNLDGLINSQEYYQSMLDGTTAEFLTRLKIDYVYGNPYMLLESDPYAGIFAGRLEKVGALGGNGGTVLYKFLR